MIDLIRYSSFCKRLKFHFSLVRNHYQLVIFVVLNQEFLITIPNSYSQQNQSQQQMSMIFSIKKFIGNHIIFFQYCLNKICCLTSLGERERLDPEFDKNKEFVNSTFYLC